MQNKMKSGAIDMFTGIGGLGALLPVRPVVYLESGDFVATHRDVSKSCRNDFW